MVMIENVRIGNVAVYGYRELDPRKNHVLFFCQVPSMALVSVGFPWYLGRAFVSAIEGIFRFLTRPKMRKGPQTMETDRVPSEGRSVASSEPSPVEESIAEQVTLTLAYDRFVSYLCGSGASNATLAAYHSRLNLFFRWLGERGVTQLGQLSYELVDEWAASLSGERTLYKNHAYRQPETGQLSPATVAGRKRTVKTYLKWCYERGYVGEHYGAQLRQGKLNHSVRSRLMSLGDLHRMLDVARDQMEGGQARDLALLMFAADTGARRGELANLLKQDVDLERLEAIVTGKTGERPVDFTSPTADVLRLWLKQHPAPTGDFVFVSMNPRQSEYAPLTVWGVYQIFRRLAETAGVRGRWNPQALRHLVGQRWADLVNLELVREKLGHTSIVTTAMFYAHQDRERVKAATQLHSLLNGYQVDSGGEDTT